MECILIHKDEVGEVTGLWMGMATIFPGDTLHMGGSQRKEQYRGPEHAGPVQAFAYMESKEDTLTDKGHEMPSGKYFSLATGVKLCPPECPLCIGKTFNQFAITNEMMK